MRWYGADLHIHSALSACAADAMTPGGVADAVCAAGIHLAAITDHNSCGNAAVFGAALEGRQVTPIYGMELETREEVHVLCLFGTLAAAMKWHDWVQERLPPVPNDEQVFGQQLLFDAEGQVAAKVDNLLSLASDIGLAEAAAEVVAGDGLCIPAHVDRPAYSLFGSLGLVPPDVVFAAFEVSPRANPEGVRDRYGLDRQSLVSFSDAHRLGEIMPARTALLLAEPSFAEFGLALRNEAGRKVVVLD